MGRTPYLERQTTGPRNGVYPVDHPFQIAGAKSQFVDSVGEPAADPPRRWQAVVQCGCSRPAPHLRQLHNAGRRHAADDQRSVDLGRESDGEMLQAGIG
jgi:hypothetical protein